MRGQGLSLLRRLVPRSASFGGSLSSDSVAAAAASSSTLLRGWAPPATTLDGRQKAGTNHTLLTFERGFAVPKRKVSRSRKRMRENHPSKRIRSKKQYSYCEKCDEVFGPHQICTGVLAGTCNIKKGAGADQ